jgi:AcrR family transcriptional regulator
MLARRSWPDTAYGRKFCDKTGTLSMSIDSDARTARRLEPAVRAEQILDEATRFFAERGFNAQITDLAARLGVSHALIFRYFGTKQNLIDRVYQRVFVEPWSEDWMRDLADRSVPLQARIERFYMSYLEIVDNPLWIRVALHAGLAGEHLPRGKEVRNRVEQVLELILRELRAHRGMPQDPPIDPVEWETAWHLHSFIIYFLIRKYVLDHGSPVARSLMVQRVVENFFCEFARP